MIYETIRVGSVTYAQKAKRLLAAHGIRGNTVKVAETSEEGCVFGVRIPGDRLRESSRILQDAGISHSVGKAHR